LGFTHVSKVSQIRTIDLVAKDLDEDVDFLASLRDRPGEERHEDSAHQG
jgi:hypothetical protein